MRDVTRRKFLAAGFAVGSLLLVTALLSTFSVVLVIKCDKRSYPVGSSAHIDILLTYGPNLVRGAVTIPSASYEILISGPSGPVLAARAYVHTEEPLKILPNTTQKIGEFDWDLRDASGNLVTPGSYAVTVTLLDYPVSGEANIHVY
mgnify:CR=1 FL=1